MDDFGEKNVSWVLQCAAWCKQVKYLNDEIVWSEKPSRSDYLLATSALLDGDKKTIPHLSFKGEFRPGKRGDQMSYGLMYHHGRDIRRVFMLEVYPQHIRSHIERDGTEMFGPHIHLGDERLEQVTREVLTQIGTVTAHAWLERFRRHARIKDYLNAKLESPFGDELF
ncbi:hypothetical protein [Comamonas kerstersii]|uniref:hypothetical protein n=1 Tax=Comamonas kerstersii TaxID=225992 RepID=UPI0026DBE2A5|nr:hypothetical protein [Comamonas kerstersii]